MGLPSEGAGLERGELQRRVVTGVVWTWVHTMVSLPLAFLVNILVARVLGVVDYGRLAYLTTVIGLASGLAGLAVATALVQFGAKAHAAGRTEEVRRYLSGAQGFQLMVSGPVVGTAVVLLVDVDPWLMALALIFGVLLPALFSTANETLTIENRSDRSAQLAMVQNVLMQVAVVAAVLLIGTPDAVWSARVVATGVMLALPLWFISRSYRWAVLRPRPFWTLPRVFWAFALPTAAAGILGTLAVERTQLLFLEWFSNPEAMGLFGLAFGLASHVFAPAQALTGPLTPAVSGLAEVDRPALRNAFLRTTRVASAVGGVLVVTALPALASLVPLLYGDDFSPAADLLVVLGLATAVMLIGSPHYAFLMARLAGRRLVWVNLVSVIVNVVVALSMIPFFGAWGATLSCAAGVVVRALQLSIGEARAISVSMRELIDSVTTMAVATSLAAVLWVAVRAVSGPPLLSALIVSLVGGLAYITLLKLLGAGLTSGDVGAITAALPERRRGAGRRALWLLSSATTRT